MLRRFGPMGTSPFFRAWFRAVTNVVIGPERSRTIVERGSSFCFLVVFLVMSLIIFSLRICKF